MLDLISQLQAQAAGNPLGLVALTFAVCFVSSLVPLVHSEAYLISVSALCAPQHAVPLVLGAALGQMMGKSLLYLTGRGLLHLPLRRHEPRIAAARARFEKWRGRTGLFLFASAASGFPPFYAVSVLAGVLRLDFGRFLVAGVLGRCLRFATVVAIPQLLRHWS